MGDRTKDLMNLDLNLGSVPEPSGPPTGPSSREHVNVDQWESPYIRDALRQRIHRHWGRWRHGHLTQLPFGSHSLGLMVDSDGNGGDLGVGSGLGVDVDADDNGGTLQAGEGSVAPEKP